MTRAVLNPALDFLEATIFHTYTVPPTFSRRLHPGPYSKIHIRNDYFHKFSLYYSYFIFNPNLFLCVFNFSDLPDSQRRAGTQSSSPSASDWLFSNCEMRQVLQTWTGERWDSILSMFKQNKMTYQCPSRKSGTTRKSRNVLPEMLKLCSWILGT